MSAKEKKFHVFGQTLAALSWEGEGEPVLALHGWLDNAASYIPLAAEWSRTMVALDFSGHGHSDHRPDLRQLRHREQRRAVAVSRQHQRRAAGRAAPVPHGVLAQDRATVLCCRLVAALFVHALHLDHERM